MGTPLGTSLPIPSITIGRGTIFRVGITDSVKIKTGEAVKIGSQPESSPSSSTPIVMGDGSLSIETKDTSKALEKMRDLMSKPETAGASVTPPK